MQFKFNFGNKKPDIKQYAIIGLILTTIITSISRCTNIDEKVLWDGLDEVQRRYFPKSAVNDFIIKDPEKLQRRIHRDVDRAIDLATPEYDRIIEQDNFRYKPRYIEEENNEEVCYTPECKALAPPMRICASWYEGCPDTFKTGTPPQLKPED